MIVEKELNAVAIGDYVVDIVKQKGTYALTSAGHIKNSKVVHHLSRKGVLSVLVDTSKAIKIANAEQKPLAKPEKPPAPVSTSAQTTSPTTKKPQGPVIVEITRARKVFTEAKNVHRRILNDIINGREINVEPVIHATNNTIEAVFKNPDALACVINIRKKDEYLLEHSVSVSILMTIFAKYLAFDKALTQQLAIGAFLHDIGKIKIDDQILNKPGRLSESEREVMETHVNHSIDIITHTAGISELSLEVAALHHERLNGVGYPYNLQADEISKYGRMIAICDVFDAMTADRCYKESYSHIKAFNLLRKLAQEGQLDVVLVDQFIKCLGVYPVGSLVELSSNKLAIVEERNQFDPIRPKVRSFYSIDSYRYVMTEDIDLSKTEDFIVKGVRADDYSLDMNKIVEFLMMQG